jgi:hypothetical protein
LLDAKAALLPKSSRRIETLSLIQARKLEDAHG